MDEVQVELREVRRNVRRLDKRLEELHPAWCEYWRVKTRKAREEKKLRRLSY